jgi:putative tryptophan/tyrosine transport system substrate-binding protein
MAMRRREFIAGLSGAAAWPVVARAQQAIPVVGYLSAATPQAAASYLRAIRNGLRETGFVEGKNVAFEYRFAANDLSRLPALAAELVGSHVSVLFAVANAALVAKATTSTIPIVFVAGLDPVKSGLASSLNRPGTNATGVSFFFADLEAKRLGILHETVPTTNLIGVLLNPTNPAFELQSRDISEAARGLGLEIHSEQVSDDEGIDRAFGAFAQARTGAVLVGADPFFITNRKVVIASAEKSRIPAMYPIKEFPQAGGLMSYGTDLIDAYRRAGGLVGRILKGENPAELPIEQTTSFEFVINLKIAKGLGLELPPTLLARADEVIE